MDEIIQYIVREYHLAVKHTLTISSIIAIWVVLCGCIRFGIAIYRRAKGIYPPAESLREGH